MTTESAICQNCDAHLSGPFCAYCGQEHFEREPTLKQVLADAVEEVIKVDGRVLVTLKTLFTAPGKLTVDFFEGRRIRYAAPLKLYLTCSAIYFLFANFNEIQMRIVKNGVLVGRTDLDGNAEKLIVSIIQQGTDYFFSHLATIYILIVPITAFTTAILFAGRKRSLLFHLVFVLHVWSALFLVGALVNALHIKMSFFALFLIAAFVYMTFAARRTFRANWIESTIKGLLFSLSTVTLSVLALFVIVIVVALQKRTELTPLAKDVKSVSQSQTIEPEPLSK